MRNIIKEQIHESLEMQLKDIDCLDPYFKQLALNGLDCDEIPEARGFFGSLSNPIPVNGPFGELKYLGKLRGISGFPLFFHRLGSGSSPTCKHSVDIYETVCLDGSQWTTLYFDMYHPRRSNLAPDGYTLRPIDQMLGQDSPYFFGVNVHVTHFPYGIAEIIEKKYGEYLGPAVAQMARESLERYDFQRPETGHGP